MFESEVEKARNDLATDRLDMSFGEIMSMYNSEEIIIDPDFQRLFRWTPYQQTRFIESLLLGIPIPPIFVAEDENGKWELVDGLQRLSTVLSFFGILKQLPDKNKWILLEGDLIENLKGYTIDNLPLKHQLSLKRAVCRIEIVKWNSAMDMRYELFNRLNTGGSTLTDQEIRNCIFRGISSDFNDFLKKIASNSDFVEIIRPTEKQMQELYLEELVLRFASLYDKRENIKEAMTKHMTEYMRDVVNNDSFDYSVGDLFIRVINVLKPLGWTIFRFNNSSFSTSLYDAITIGVADNIEYFEEQSENILAEKIELLKENVDFRKLTGSAASSKTRVISRLKIADEIFRAELYE